MNRLTPTQAMIFASTYSKSFDDFHHHRVITTLSRTEYAVVRAVTALEAFNEFHEFTSLERTGTEILKVAKTYDGGMDDLVDYFESKENPWHPTSEVPIDDRAVLARQAPRGAVFTAYCPTYKDPTIDRKSRWHLRNMEDDGISGSWGIQDFNPEGIKWCYIPGDEI